MSESALPPDVQRLLQYYQNRSLVFQAAVEGELEKAQASVDLLQKVLATAKEIDAKFGVAAAPSAKEELSSRIRSLVPSLAGKSDAEIAAILRDNPGLINNG